MSAYAKGLSTISESNGDWLPGLYGAHRDKLAASGLNADTIREAGIRSTADLGEIAALLNRRRVERSLGPCLVFPFCDESGAVVLNRVRPNNPPIDKKSGKPRKYLQPSGAPPRLYIPPAVFRVLGDPTARLLITEGELKSLKATQEGFMCVGLCGVDCWHARKRLDLLPDLARIAWKGRSVYIAFDSDAADNEAVTRNERELAVVLKAQGAVVKVVRIPTGPLGSDAKSTKMGLDDFLVAHGAPALHKLLQDAADPVESDASEFKADARNADPASEAAHILEFCQLGDWSRLRFWRSSWWWWVNGRYGEKPPEEVRAEVVNWLNDGYIGVRARLASDVLDQLKAKAMLASKFEPPTWLFEAIAAWLARRRMPGNEKRHRSSAVPG